MVGRKRRDVPASLARGRDRFEAWRRVRKVRTRIPDQLWNLAVKLAVAYGLNRAASVLKLDYYSLKKRVEAKDAARSSAVSAFVEVSPLAMTAVGECVVEFEDGAGASMRIHLSGCEVPDLVALGRSFWSGE
jgi:hypothetical protein